MAHKLIALTAITFLVLGCALTNGAGGHKAPVGGARIEVENFKLTKARIEKHKDASGGRLVVLTHEESEAQVTVPLQKGDYELIVYGYAPSYDEDGFFVHIAGLNDVRMVIPNIKKILPTKPLKFTMPKDGPCTLIIALGEEHVKFDVVVIRPVKK